MGAIETHADDGGPFGELATWLITARLQSMKEVDIIVLSFVNLSEIKNKSMIMSSFKSSGDIQKKEGGQLFRIINPLQ